MTDGAEVDWALLRAMRAGFLEAGEAGAAESAALPDYWASERHLASYDATFAERIRWKWDAVLAELQARRVVPPAGATVFDFGTGTGIATRAFLAAFPGFSAKIADRSERALQFAEARIKAEAPGTAVGRWDPKVAALPPRAILLVSHVVTELDAPTLAQLVRLAASAELTIWVEPGTSTASRTLNQARETLRATRHVVAPCGHSGPCGLAAPANVRHWCHNFARPPAEVSQSALWARFRRELGIDLRSLPVSFLVLAKEAAPPLPGARVLGRPRTYKGHAKTLQCDESGVRERDVQKRDAKAGGTWSQLEDGDFTSILPAPILG